LDNKLLGSNIRWYSRYGIVHETIRKYCGGNGIKDIKGEEKEREALRAERYEGMAEECPVIGKCINLKHKKAKEGKKWTVNTKRGGGGFWRMERSINGLK
jgi:hypothetical protein